MAIDEVSFGLSRRTQRALGFSFLVATAVAIASGVDLVTHWSTREFWFRPYLLVSTPPAFYLAGRWRRRHEHIVVTPSAITLVTRRNSPLVMGWNEIREVHERSWLGRLELYDARRRCIRVETQIEGFERLREAILAGLREWYARIHEFPRRPAQLWGYAPVLTIFGGLSAIMFFNGNHGSGTVVGLLAALVVARLAREIRAVELGPRGVTLR